MNKFCFIDLETSGLNPLVDKILEVGCIITNDKLEEIETYSAVPHQEIASLQMDSWCFETHTASGLLEEVAKSTIRLDEIEKDLDKIMRRHFPVSRAALCGNSINFDKRFIETYMPIVARRLHYRVIDVSSFMLGVSMYHGITIPKTREVTVHRVMPDLRDSIYYLKTYLDRFN